MTPILFLLLFQPPGTNPATQSSAQSPQVAPPTLGGDIKPSLALPQDAITVTISPQPPASVPYALPKGLSLYSAVACAPTSTRVRVVNAGQIRQIAEGAGIAFTDPQLVPPMVTRYVARTLTGRMLGVVSYTSTGIGAAGAGLAAFKSAQPNIGNAHTWDIVAMAGATLGAAIPIAQKMLQSDVQSQQATITNGVQAAMITDMGATYTVPVAGCSRSVMFLGAGPVGIVRSVLQ
jgi:hypothetical protein